MGFFVDFGHFEMILLLDFHSTGRPQQQEYPQALSSQQHVIVVVVVVVVVAVAAVALFALLFPVQGLDSSGLFAQISETVGLHKTHRYFSSVDLPQFSLSQTFEEAAAASCHLGPMPLS